MVSPWALKAKTDPAGPVVGTATAPRDAPQQTETQLPLGGQLQTFTCHHTTPLKDGPRETAFCAISLR